MVKREGIHKGKRGRRTLEELRQKTCKKCGKNISKSNSSGFCRLHYILSWRKNKIKSLKSNHQCITCSLKVEPKVIYLVRCQRCNDNQNKYNRKGRKKLLLLKSGGKDLYSLNTLKNQENE